MFTLPLPFYNKRPVSFRPHEAEVKQNEYDTKHDSGHMHYVVHSRGMWNLRLLQTHEMEIVLFHGISCYNLDRGNMKSRTSMTARKGLRDPRH